MAPNDKVHVSSATLDTNVTIPPELQDQLKTAMLHSGGIKTIESTLREELARSGWTDNLKKHIQELMRSGQALTYNEIMAQLEHDLDSGKASNGTNGANGTSNLPIGERLPEDGGLKVPASIMQKGIQVTKQEVERIADVHEDTSRETPESPYSLRSKDPTSRRKPSLKARESTKTSGSH